MATKSQAMAVAQRFGFVLDEETSGQVGLDYTVCLDHPTHGFYNPEDPECRSIVCSSYPGDGRTASQNAWSDAIARMLDEGPHLVPCIHADCEYHHVE